MEIAQGKGKSKKAPEIWKFEKDEEGDGLAEPCLFLVVQTIDGGSRRSDGSGVSEKGRGRGDG